MLYKGLVSKKRCCTRKPRYKVCRWWDVECCVICGLPSPPTSIDLHKLNSDYFPVRFAFPNETSSRHISSFVVKKVILVLQVSDEIQDIQDIHIHIQDHIQDSPISRMRWSGRQTSSESSGSSFWKSERLFTFFNCLLQPLTLFWIEVIHNEKHAIYRFLEAINQLLSTLEQWCHSNVKQQLLTILHGRRAAPDWLTSMAASTTMAASYWPTLLLTLLSPVRAIAPQLNS